MGLAVAGKACVAKTRFAKYDTLRLSHPPHSHYRRAQTLHNTKRLLSRNCERIFEIITPLFCEITDLMLSREENIQKNRNKRAPLSEAKLVRIFEHDQPFKYSH